MDIETIEGDLYGLGYTYDPQGRLLIAAALYGSELDHTMTRYKLRRAPAASNWRRNTAASDWRQPRGQSPLSS